jgi:hypothetical protein
MKTPEQSLNEFIEFYVNRIDRSEDGLVEECLKDGAKWQAERMYSEQEVLRIIDSFEKLCYNYQSNKDWIQLKKSEWFKQFKK